MTEEIRLGQVVRSKAGRDKGRYLVIVGLPAEGWVLVADGDLRRMQKPKKKKSMHLHFTRQEVTADFVCHPKNLDNLNATLRKELKRLGYSKEGQHVQEGCH